MRVISSGFTNSVAHRKLQKGVAQRDMGKETKARTDIETETTKR